MILEASLSYYILLKKGTSFLQHPSYDIHVTIGVYHTFSHSAHLFAEFLSVPKPLKTFS